MRGKWLLFPLVLALVFPALLRADYLRVSRSATLKDQPSAQANALANLKTGDTLRLLEAEQTNGYYHAEFTTGGHAGWVYRTLVRRYSGEPEEPTVGGEPAPVGPATGTGSLGQDASAYAIPH